MPKRTTPAKAAHRLSLSQILEMVLTRASDHSTVTLSRNAKGETQIDVQIRTGSQDDITTVEQAEQAARAIYNRLRDEYPLPVKGDEGEITLTRNAKGDTQIAVELKTGTTEETLTIEQARDRASDVYEQLRGRWPAADGTVGK